MNVFINQKTAYDMRMSDWSSDVCSSDLQPKKSLGEINPPVVKFAGNAQPLGSLRVVAFKRLQEISGALGCVGALNDGGIVGPLVLFGRTIKRWADALCRGAACLGPDANQERKGGVWGKSGAVRVERGGR